MTRRPFGHLPDGKAVYAYRLQGDDGFSVEVLDYGGIIREILVPDRGGTVENVVLNYDNLSDYEKNPAYIGALVGRTGGRIGPEGLTIDGKRYSLDQNHGGLTLHGGLAGFHGKSMEVVASGDSSLDMRFVSPEGEGGFPGELDVTLSYRVKAWSLEMTIAIRTTAPTYVNPTHHTYFNLSGDPTSTVKRGILQIDGDAVAQLDDQMLPVAWQPIGALGLGEKATEIGQLFTNQWDQLATTRGIDHPFRLRGEEDRPAALCHDPLSGRSLRVYTDAPCLVVYTGNFLSEAAVPSGRRFDDHAGICFEAQDVPDAPNNKLSGHQILRPGEVQRRRITYRFN